VVVEAVPRSGGAEVGLSVHPTPTTGRPDLQPVQLFGANGWGGDPSLFDTSPGGAGRHLRCAIYVDGFYAGSERPETKRFVSTFQERFGRTPTILEASAYDAARMVAQAVDRDKAQGREAVRTALAATRAFPGATGELAFDGRGEPVRTLFFLTIEKGALREMRPEEMVAGPALAP